MSGNKGEKAHLATVRQAPIQEVTWLWKTQKSKITFKTSCMETQLLCPEPFSYHAGLYSFVDCISESAWSGTVVSLFSSSQVHLQETQTTEQESTGATLKLVTSYGRHRTIGVLLIPDTKGSQWPWLVAVEYLIPSPCCILKTNGCYRNILFSWLHVYILILKVFGTCRKWPQTLHAFNPSI